MSKTLEPEIRAGKSHTTENDSSKVSNLLKDKKEILNATSEEISEAKLWLFKENMRLLELSRELEEKRENLEREEASLRKEISEEMKKLKIKESQLILEKKHVDDRLNILRRGFEELNADRAVFEAKQKNINIPAPIRNDNGIVFFRGIDNIKQLKKRYKELLKIFHPDNSGGDEQTVILIRSEYEELLDIL